MDLTNSPGHLNHQFVAEDAATLRAATEISPGDMNGPMNELVNIIRDAQIVPDTNNHAQVLAALKALFTKRDGDTGLIRTLTPAGGARIRELGDIANAATVGGIEFGISYNCNIDPATGAWSGRDVADLCWLEKWSDAGGLKEYWLAPAAAAGTVPVWSRAFLLDMVNGVFYIGNSSALTQSAADARYARAATGRAVGELFWSLAFTPLSPGALVLPTSATTASRSAYPELNNYCAVYNYPWGAGDGATTFGLPYLPADQTIVQANGNLRSYTVGQLLSHTHSGVITGMGGNNGGTGPGTSEVPTQGNTSSVGGSANLPAGMRALLCIQYKSS